MTFPLVALVIGAVARPSPLAGQTSVGRAGGTKITASCASPFQAPKLEPDSSSEDVLVNALTAELRAPSGRQAKEHVLRVVVYNANPFLHDIRVRQTSEPVREVAPAAFLKLALGLALPDLGTIPPVLARKIEPLPSPPSGKQPLVAIARACDPIQKVFPQLAHEDTTLSNQYVKLRDEMITERMSLARLDTAVAKSVILVRADTLTTPVVFKAACDALATVTAQRAAHDAKLEDLRTRVKSFTSAVKDFRDSVLAALGAAPDCKNLEPIVSDADDLQQAVDALTTNLAALDRAAKDRAALVSSLQGPLDHPDRFFVFGSVGPFAESSDATIIVEQRPAGSDGAYTTLAQTKLAFGAGRIFGLGVGGAWSGITTRTYRVRSEYRAPSGAGSGDSLVSVIAIDDESGSHVVPMITLDVLLPTSRCCAKAGVSFHALIGVSYRGTGGPTNLSDLEYVPALGVSFWDGKLLVGGGAVAGRQRYLQEGYQLGELVPAGSGAVPTRVRTVWLPTGVITLRLY